MKKEYKIKETVTHQKIGGEIFYPEFKLDFDEVVHNAIYENNIACMNFLKRRTELYKIKNKIFYYGKVKQKEFYLGYVVCEDELEEM